MLRIEQELQDLINDVLKNEDSTGFESDLTTTTKDSCDRLRAYMKRYEDEEQNTYKGQ